MCVKGALGEVFVTVSLAKAVDSIEDCEVCESETS